MRSILYFAYGSNMLTERLRVRCGSATPLCTAVADGYALAFSKKGRDGSGKATIVSCSGGDRTCGVLFNLDERELPALDRYEGAGSGYDRVPNLLVRARDNDRRPAVTTYIARPDAIDGSLSPFDWYLGLVAAGARQHALPADYIRKVEAVPSVRDPHVMRATRLEALRLLQKLD